MLAYLLFRMAFEVVPFLAPLQEISFFEEYHSLQA
jgi:hypothetical protein